MFFWSAVCTMRCDFRLDIYFLSRLAAIMWPKSIRGGYHVLVSDLTKRKCWKYPRPVSSSLEEEEEEEGSVVQTCQKWQKLLDHGSVSIRDLRACMIYAAAWSGKFYRIGCLRPATYTRVSMCNKLSGQSRWLRLTLRYSRLCKCTLLFRLLCEV